MEEFIALTTLQNWDKKAAVIYAHIRADLKTKGTLIGNMDMLIAVHALSLNATLVTNNLREFERVIWLMNTNNELIEIMTPNENEFPYGAKVTIFLNGMVNFELDIKGNLISLDNELVIEFQLNEHPNSQFQEIFQSDLNIINHYLVLFLIEHAAEGCQFLDMGIRYKQKKKRILLAVLKRSLNQKLSQALIERGFY